MESNHNLGWTIKITDLSLLVCMPDKVSCELRDGYFIIKNNGDIRVNPYKRVLKQFDTPSIMRPFIGREIKLSKNYINPEEGEIFRIYIDNHEIDSSVPYFTACHLNIPRTYIGKKLNERSMALMASFARTTTGMIDEGVLQIFLTETKEPLSNGLYLSGKQLRCNISTAIRRIINENLNEFEYEKTIDVSPYYKYGVMVFRRKHG